MSLVKDKIRLIDTPDALDEVRSLIVGMTRVALDLEAAGFHRYTDRLSLVQLTAGPFTFLLDPLSLDLQDILRPVVEDPAVELIMHGSDFDIRLLDRDLGLRPQALFDTQVAAQLLGKSGIGLSSLLESYFDVPLSKKFQRADWARRPLPADMLEYAAHDTLHLERLADILLEELEEAGRVQWAHEENRVLEAIRWDPPDEDRDPVVRVKKTRDLSDREIDRLRVALEWRDRIAEARDRAAFRVAGDQVLIRIARENPESEAGLADLKGLNGSLARDEGRSLLEGLRQIDQLPDEELRGYPRHLHVDNGRRPRMEPEVEKRFHRVRSVRNETAESLGIDRGAFLPNAVLQTLAEEIPQTVDEIRQIPDIRQWQVNVAGSELVNALYSS